MDLWLNKRLMNQIDQWVNQIRNATIEASQIHNDALPYLTWEDAIQD